MLNRQDMHEASLLLLGCLEEAYLDCWSPVGLLFNRQNVHRPIRADKGRLAGVKGAPGHVVHCLLAVYSCHRLQHPSTVKTASHIAIT